MVQKKAEEGTDARYEAEKGRAQKPAQPRGQPPKDRAANFAFGDSVDVVSLQEKRRDAKRGLFGWVKKIF